METPLQLLERLIYPSYHHAVTLWSHTSKVWRVAQWTRFDVNMLEVPAPTDHGWVLSKDILEPA